VLSAFGRRGTTPTYLNTYDLYDDARADASKFIVKEGTVQNASGTIATTAAYLSAVGGPLDGSSHVTECYFAGGYNGTLQAQVWKATVANSVVTWTKPTSMNHARARFGLALVGTSTKQLAAVGGGFGNTYTNTIETFDLAVPGTWTDSGTTLSDPLHSFGFAKLSDTKLITAGGAKDNGSGTQIVSDQFNAIKVSTAGAIVSKGNFRLDGTSNVIMSARKDNIILPTGQLPSGGTDKVEVYFAMGVNATPTLETTTGRVVIDWNSGATAPSYVSNSAGTAPTTDAAFPTVVDAYVSPNNAASNPGYLILSGNNAAGTAVATIRKWNTSPAGTTTGGGSWGATAAFATSKTGVNAVYVKSLDKVIASGGVDQFTPAGSTTLNSTDVIQ